MNLTTFGPQGQYREPYLLEDEDFDKWVLNGMAEAIGVSHDALLDKIKGVCYNSDYPNSVMRNHKCRQN